MVFFAETGHDFWFFFLSFGACHSGFGVLVEAGLDGIFPDFTAASCYMFELVVILFFVFLWVEFVTGLPDCFLCFVFSCPILFVV